MDSDLNIEDNCIEKYSLIIAKKYNLQIDEARSLTVEAINAFEAHGGYVKDYSGMIKVIDVVVKSWLQTNK